MKHKENHLYFIKDEHFAKYSKYGLFYSPRTNEKKDRPHFLCFKNKNNVYWVIPLSSKVSKYKKEYNKEVAKYRRSLKFHFAKVSGIENAFLIQNAFPVPSYYIKKEYMKDKRSVLLENQSDIKAINQKLKSFLHQISKGVIFYNSQPDVLSLEKEIIQDMKDRHYINSIKRENAKLSVPFELNKSILNSILEYSKSSNKYKTLKQIAKDYSLDKKKDIKNPLLQSIGVYFKTQQENITELAPKQITTKKIVNVKAIELER